MTKLNWENTWGKVDWKNVTPEEIKRLLAIGAGRNWHGKGPDGQEMYPDELAKYYFSHFSYVDSRTAHVDTKKMSIRERADLIKSFLKEESSIRAMLWPNEVDVFLRKKEQAEKRYNEKEELKKKSWGELNWYAVTPKVIEAMIKKGKDVNEAIPLFKLERHVDYYETDAVPHPQYHSSYSEKIIGKTRPLFLALNAKNKKVALALLEAGADPRQEGILRDDWHIHNFVAHELDDIEVARSLKQHGLFISPDDFEEIEAREAKRKRLEAEGLGCQPKPLDLVKKGQILDAASAPLRRKRETLTKKASEAGTPLSKDEIRKMRDDEGRARAKKLKELLKNSQTLVKKRQQAQK